MFAWHVLSLLIWVALCAVQDARTRLISNVLTLGGAALAFVYLCWTGQSWLGASWPLTMAGVLVALLLSVPGYVLKQLGAGDVKLLCFIALASDLEVITGTVAVAGLGFALGLLYQHRTASAARWANLQCCRNSQPGSQRLRKGAFAPWVLLGVVVCLVWRF